MNAPSYGERYFYSASLSKYKEVLQFKNGDSVVKKKVKKTFTDNANLDINLFSESVFESGLVFSEKLITRFVSSLLTKPFVLLSVLSGSEKTKIAQSFVKWMCEDKSY